MQENVQPPHNENAQPRFRVTAFPTIDPAVEDRWECSIGIQPPKFVRVMAVHAGQPFDLLVFFGGYGTDPHMLADVDFSWRILDAGGKEVADAGKLDGIKGRVLHGDFLLRPKNRLQITFPAGLPPGEYRVAVDARCHISGRDSHSEIAIGLQDFSFEREFKDADEVQAWIDAYMDAPNPARVWDAYLTLFDTVGKTAPDAFFIGLAFCAEVLVCNPWLAKLLAGIWPQLGPRQRDALTLLLHAARFQANESPLAAALTERMKAPFPSPADLLMHAVSHPQELDFLWAIYRANGSYRVFKHICNAVGPMPEALRAVVPEDMQEQIVQAAAWSIDQHIQKQPLSMIYVMALFKDSGLDARVTMFMEGLLQQYGWVRNEEFGL